MLAITKTPPINQDNYLRYNPRPDVLHGLRSQKRTGIQARYFVLLFDWAMLIVLYQFVKSSVGHTERSPTMENHQYTKCTRLHTFCGEVACGTSNQKRAQSSRQTPYRQEFGRAGRVNGWVLRNEIKNELTHKQHEHRFHHHC